MPSGEDKDWETRTPLPLSDEPECDALVGKTTADHENNFVMWAEKTILSEPMVNTNDERPDDWNNRARVTESFK